MTSSSKMTGLVFITGNQNKADQLSKWLGLPIKHRKLDLEEIQSLEPREIADHKARQAYQQIKRPVLVEDVSLVFKVLGRLPGPFVKFFEQSIGEVGMCRLLDGHSDRSAVAMVTYCLFDGKEPHFFEAEMTGTIAQKPRGDGGFGFDSIFINDDFKQTRAEMSQTDYTETSYRLEALKKLHAYLANAIK